MMRHLGVDEQEPVDARAVLEREATREGAAGILRQDAVTGEAEAIDERLQRPSLSGKTEIGAGAPLRVAHAGEVGDEASVALREAPAALSAR